MTNRLALLAYWLARYKLNRVISVQLRRSVRAFKLVQFRQNSHIQLRISDRKDYR